MVARESCPSIIDAADFEYDLERSDLIGCVQSSLKSSSGSQRPQSSQKTPLRRTFESSAPIGHGPSPVRSHGPTLPKPTGYCQYDNGGEDAADETFIVRGHPGRSNAAGVPGVPVVHHLPEEVNTEHVRMVDNHASRRTVPVGRNGRHHEESRGQNLINVEDLEGEHQEHLDDGNGGHNLLYVNDGPVHSRSYTGNQGVQQIPGDQMYRSRRPNLKIQSQILFPHWSTEEDPQQVLDQLKMLIELGYSTEEVICGFCLQNNLGALLLAMTAEGRKNFNKFSYEFKKRYGLSLASAVIQFNRITQKEGEDPEELLVRIKRSFNMTMGLPPLTPVQNMNKPHIKERFISALLDSCLLYTSPSPRDRG